MRRATDTLDVNGVSGFASYPDVLERAGASDADMIIAATHTDEVNMVVCQVAHSIFGVPRKIARLRSQSYLDAIYSDLYRRDHLPIDVVISPELEVAEAALKRLSTPTSFDTESFLDGTGAVLDFGSMKTVRDQHALAAIDRFVFNAAHDCGGCAPSGVLFAPEAGDQLFPGDECYVCAIIRIACAPLKFSANPPQSKNALSSLAAETWDNVWPKPLNKMIAVCASR